MPYTDPWDEALPDGNESGDQIDDIIRRLMQQIRERMNTVLGGNNWSADPIGVLTGHMMVQHWSAGTMVSGCVVEDNGDWVSCASGGAGVIVVPFMVPLAATIRRLYVNGTATGAATLKCELVQIPPGYAGVTELTEFTITGQGGWDGGQSAALAVENDDVYSYYVRVTMNRPVGQTVGFNDLVIEYDKSSVLVGN